MRALASASAAVIAALIVTAPPATADSLPFTDQNANGYIGFCDKSGHQVTSGDIGVAPFTWLAVSSSPAPQGYPAGKGRGTLDVYQPRQNVDPGQWTGKQMTAASTYTNATHPMAQGTGADPALVDFTSVFPPSWDGLIEFRMYFTAPNSPEHSIPYPATVVRVSGTRWTVVSGGSVPCNAGSATSAETFSLPKSLLTQAANRSTPGATAAPSATASSRSKPASGAATTVAPGQSAGSTNAPGASNAAAATKKSSGGSGGAIVGALIAAAVVASGAAAFLWRRRRISGGT
jgi:hypothetical protein